MPKDILLEISLDSVESAIAAEKGGAGRVELCRNLTEGGITPGSGIIELARKHISIPLFVMIRPRPGDFCYSDYEFEIMKRDIILSKNLGADGVVFGILKPEKTIDVERMEALIQLARPKQVTFHRAFDIVSDPFTALDDLIGLGVNRLLTSGQCNSAFEGISLISELVQRSNNRIAVMPGCGIHQDNIQTIRKKTSATEFHIGTAAHTRQQGDGKFQFGSKVFVDAEKVGILLNAVYNDQAA
jgi:copper homeostasis protein